MRKIIAYCGIVCSDCPVLIATQKDDDSERKRVAEMFTRQYGRRYKPEEINCDGCIIDSPRLLHYCAREKNVENCAHCKEYPCDKLSGLFSEYPKAKQTLDEIRGVLC